MAEVSFNTEGWVSEWRGFKGYIRGAMMTPTSNKGNVGRIKVGNQGHDLQWRKLL